MGEPIWCRHLGADVQLSQEREEHIALRHPDLLPAHRKRIVETIEDPDEVRTTARAANARMFSRWFDDLRGGKHVVVVVVSETARERHWVVTAYMARRLAPGDVEWARS